MVFRITAGRPATKPIMMMVRSLRPKITRNSGYISTVGADAIAATQVSVASRSSFDAMQQHADADAERPRAASSPQQALARA